MGFYGSNDPTNSVKALKEQDYVTIIKHCPHSIMLWQHVEGGAVSLAWRTALCGLRSTVPADWRNASWSAKRSFIIRARCRWEPDRGREGGAAGPGRRCQTEDDRRWYSHAKRRLGSEIYTASRHHVESTAADITGGRWVGPVRGRSARTDRTEWTDDGASVMTAA